MSRLLSWLAIIVATVGVAPSVQASPLPPDMVDLLRSLGIVVDENGEVVAPPAPAEPVAPAEPLSDEELFAILGISPTGSPPSASEPQTPAEPAIVTEEELLAMLGLDPSSFAAPDSVPEPVAVTPPSPQAAPADPVDLADLEDLLGFSLTELAGDVPTAPATVQPPTELLTAEDLADLLGLPVDLFAPASTPGLATAIPEPSAAALLLLASLARPRRR